MQTKSQIQQHQQEVDKMSERWRNLEKYIEQKNKQKDKSDAYSHASDLLDKNMRLNNEDKTTIFSKVDQKSVFNQIQENLQEEEREETQVDFEDEDENEFNHDKQNSQYNELNEQIDNVDKKLNDLTKELMEEKRKREKLEQLLHNRLQK